MGESKNEDDDGPVKEVVGFFRKVQRAVPRDWKNLGIDIRTIIPGKKPPKKSSFDDLNKAIAGSLRPKANVQFDCDWCPRERWINVVTSAPYVYVGAQMLREVDTKPAKAVAISQMACGVVAGIYHATRGKWRTFGRRADFWTISAGSAAMTRAVYPGCSPAWSTASLAVTPFAPFATSAANTAAMEVKFLLRARENPALRKPLLLHGLTAGVGLGLFALDEVKPHIGCVHAAWHLLSCAAMYQTVPLLRDAEERSDGSGGLWGRSTDLSMQSLDR